MANNLTDISRKIFNVENTTWDAINASALIRIADATEKMATNYTNLQNDLDRYKRWYNQECEKVHNRDKTISNLRGQITKLKNKINGK